MAYYNNNFYDNNALLFLKHTKLLLTREIWGTFSSQVWSAVRDVACLQTLALLFGVLFKSACGGRLRADPVACCVCGRSGYTPLASFDHKHRQR